MSSVKDKRTSKEYYYRPSVMPGKSYPNFLGVTPYDAVAEYAPDKHSEFKKPYAAGTDGYADMEYRWDGYSPFYPLEYGIPDGVTTPTPIDGLPQIPPQHAIGITSGECQGVLIGYTTQQMVAGEVQNLTIIYPPDYPRTGFPTEYTWEVKSGGGTIDINGTYVAPSGTNTNCANNPTIALKTVGGIECDTLKIAINTASSSVAAVYCLDRTCPTPCALSGGLCGSCSRSYMCNNNYGTPGNNSLCDCIMASPNNASQTWQTCAAQGYTSGVLTDIRTGAQLTNGCCPAILL